MSVLLELFRHSNWATLQLIELCKALDVELLDAAQPGANESIGTTLWHFVAGEEGYLSALTGEPRPLSTGRPTLGELAERVRRLGPRWEEIADDAELAEREMTTRDGW